MMRLTRPTHRLTDRFRWWRHTWWFQLAHGPLCDAHRPHVLRVGRMHLCRSCTCLYVSAAAMLIALMVWEIDAVTLRIGVIALTVIAAAASYPPLYERFPRIAQDGLRAAAGLALGGWCGLLAHGQWLTAGAILAGALPVLIAYRRLRTPAKAALCDGCPERHGPSPCSGYAQQVDAIRAYQLAAEERINHAQPPRVVRAGTSTKANQLK